MKKLLLLMMLSLFGLSASAQCDAVNQCAYTFILTDSYGDGWNGNTMSVSQNGIDVAIIGAGFTDGTESTATVLLCTGVPFQVKWNDGGSFQEEVGISIFNSFGQNLYNLYPGDISLQNTVIYSGTANCTTQFCETPSSPFAYNLSATSVSIGWEYFNAASLWEVIVVPTGAPAPTASSSGILTTQTPFTIEGLVTGVSYTYYIRTVCSADLKSDWTTGQNFTLSCPVPANIYADQNNPTGATIHWFESGSATSWEVLILPVGASEPTPQTPGTLLTSTTYVASGLTTGTIYKFYVRAVCVPGQDIWSEPIYLYPSCAPPAMLNVTGLGAFGATISWTEMGSATQWEYILQPNSAAAPTPATTGTLVTTTSFTASGLTTNTTYTFYVRAVCGSTSGSWIGTSFTPTVTLPPLQTSTTQFTTAQLVTDVLVNNPCVTISNITSSTGTNYGSVNGIGSFNNINPLFPLTSGIVLSTGNVLNAPGPNSSTLSDGSPNWPGDAELENIITTATGNTMISHDATKLEFDFTTQNAQMNFNFLFASDEYGYYQCDYSDAFAFLLTDVTAAGPTVNLAIVPNTTTPVSVVTIRDAANNAGCTSQNPEFFDQYFYNTPLASATNFNGQTALMTASSAVIPGHTYHIKLVVADRGDDAFDSAVFIQAGSFAAGPPECSDKIKLVAFVDVNGNGARDPYEPDFTYGSFVYQQNNTGDINNISSPLGYYTLYDANPANTYDFSYQINAEYAPYFALMPTAFNDLNIPVGSGTQTLYFPVVLAQGFNDVTVSVVPVSPPIPGIGYTNKIVYRNLGIVPASGTVTFTADPSASITYASQSTTLTSSTLTYDFANLAPYETRSVFVNMSVPAIPTVNIGDILTDSATISAAANDINIGNNTFTNAQIAVASYDPNDKMEAHGAKIAINQFNQNDYLTYTIRFQNTGTANAINVRLEDLLDAQLDETSIRMVSASHNYVMERVGSQITWRFDYIQLPGAVQNEALSKGYVTFMIKLKPGFAAGDIVPNHADIYFDANPAIATNTFNTEFMSTLGTGNFMSQNLMIFPNPASTVVQVSLQNTDDTIGSVTLFDVLGKSIRTIQSIHTTQTAVNVSGLSKGVYMMEIITDNKYRVVKKLVIE